VYKDLQLERHITIDGQNTAHESVYYNLIYVRQATFTMEDGAKVTRHTSTDSASYGTVSMKGDTNTSGDTTRNIMRFIMNGGEISWHNGQMACPVFFSLSKKYHKNIFIKNGGHIINNKINDADANAVAFNTETLTIVDGRTYSEPVDYNKLSSE
jgi:hypothetical protein